MDDYVFAGCSKLKTVRWGSNLPYPPFTNGTQTGYISNIFKNCSSLETITNFPSNITAIRNGDFENCPKLDLSIIDLTKITSFGGNAISYDTQLPTNIMLLRCTSIANYFMRSSGNHKVYMPSITGALGQYSFAYTSLSVLDLGENSNGYIGYSALTGSPKIVLRANSVYKADGTTARYTMYNTGTIGKIYVYSDILDDFKALYTGVASKTYAIGGAEWVADFGSSDEWADYPNGVNPLTEE